MLALPRTPKSATDIKVSEGHESEWQVSEWQVSEGQVFEE